MDTSGPAGPARAAAGAAVPSVPAGSGTLDGTGWETCTVSLPEPDNWIVLDLAAEQPGAWALEEARERLGASAEPAWLQAYADDLTVAADAARGRHALSAAVFAPGGGPILAFLSLRELSVPEESWRVEALRAEAAASDGPYFQPPELTEVALPLGPALRVHRLEPSDPGSDAAGVVEGVAHYVLPGEAPGTVLELLMTWSSPALGEVLATMADAVAASARLS
ncbi:hypothetical protein [Streptomyces sp. NPDC047108]|uniref:hypothetical protein n=1 Tax=Streptomyces sp. NPDC047108 TaxID=3155025 RepID=UPI0033FC86FD